MAIRHLRLAAFLLFAVMVASARASYVEYTITVAKPLSHGGESIGGPSDPITFQFIVDRAAPNLSGLATDGTYPIGDHGVAGLGSVTIGGVTSLLQGGAFHVANVPLQDVVSGTVNLQTNTATFNGRTLFVSSAVLWDLTGQMLNNIDLPIDDSFEQYITGGAFSLTFFPTHTDPEFGTGNYVQFSTFIAPADVSVDVRLLPEPPALLLTTLLLLAVGCTQFRRRKAAEST